MYDWAGARLQAENNSLDRLLHWRSVADEYACLRKVLEQLPDTVRHDTMVWRMRLHATES